MSDFSQSYAANAYGKEQLDDPLIFEDVQDFSGGEDSFRRSTLIDPNQSQHLVNVLVRDNYEARTRPGADALPTPGALPVPLASAVHALRYFDTPVYQQLLASAAAAATPKFLKYEGGAWTDLSSSWAPSVADATPAMAQGINLMLISDGSGVPQIYDGATFLATGTGTPANDAPKGCTILCWHTSRMFASGVATAPDVIYVSSILDFHDGQWNATTRSFRVGSGDGDPIVAMASMQAYTLCVLKRNSIWLVETNPVVSDTFGGITGFTAAANPQSISDQIGCVGRDAWCSYGNDVLFMAQDGVRSVQRMQAAAGQWQLSAPLSQPIQTYIARINTAAWAGIVAIKHQEFALFFVPLDNSATNNAVLVWNGRLGRWVGDFTNWNGLCVEQTRFSGIPRMVFGDTAGMVNQWKDYASATDDATYLDNTVGYPTEVWTRSFQFGETILPKNAYNTILRFSAGNANINMTWVADLIEAETWAGAAIPSGSILGGQDTLGVSFYLASTSPIKVIKGIRGLPAFNEAYLKIESSTGWFFLRKITAGAFINALKEAS